MELLILNNALRARHLLAYAESGGQQMVVIVRQLSMLGEVYPHGCEVIPVEYSSRQSPVLVFKSRKDPRSRQSFFKVQFLRAILTKSRRNSRLIFFVRWKLRSFIRFFDFSKNKISERLKVSVLEFASRFIQIHTPRETRNISSIIHEKLQTGEVTSVTLFDVDILPEVLDVCEDWDVDVKVI